MVAPCTGAQGSSTLTSECTELRPERPAAQSGGPSESRTRPCHYFRCRSVRTIRSESCPNRARCLGKLRDHRRTTLPWATARTATRASAGGQAKRKERDRAMGSMIGSSRRRRRDLCRAEMPTSSSGHGEAIPRIREGSSKVGLLGYHWGSNQDPLMRPQYSRGSLTSTGFRLGLGTP